MALSVPMYAYFVSQYDMTIAILQCKMNNLDFFSCIVKQTNLDEKYVLLVLSA